MDIVWQKCVDSCTVEIFRCNGYFSGVFCSWSPENVCGWVTKTGWTLREIATAHGWTTTGYQLERTMAWHSAWVAHPHRATVGMQWLQNMVAQTFVAWRQVDQTCVAWDPQQRRIGRTFMTWDSPLQHFGRWQHLEDWLLTAQATDLWQHYLNDFCTFVLRWLYSSVGFTSCALNGLPTGMQAQSQSQKKKIDRIQFNPA